MACDTFIKIAQKCRRHFVQVQVGEVMPFIEEILNGINTIICDLQPQQVYSYPLIIFYTDRKNYLNFEASDNSLLNINELRNKNNKTYIAVCWTA